MLKATLPFSVGRLPVPRFPVDLPSAPRDQLSAAPATAAHGLASGADARREAGGRGPAVGAEDHRGILLVGLQVDGDDRCNRAPRGRTGHAGHLRRSWSEAAEAAPASDDSESAPARWRDPEGSASQSGVAHRLEGANAVAGNQLLRNLNLSS